MNLSILDRLSPKRRRRCIWAISVFVALNIICFIIVPPILKVVAAKQITKQIGREAHIGAFRINPYALSVTINNLMIKETNAEPFVAWERLYINLQISSLFLRAVVFDEISLIKPFGRVVINKDGSYNFSDILKKVAEGASTGKPKEPEKPSTPLTIRVGKLQIAGGRVSASDLSLTTPFATMMGPIDLNIRNFIRRPDNKNPYTFTATSETGESFSWAGYFYLDPLRSGGEFTLQNISLVKYAPFYEDAVRLRMKDGTVNVRSSYRVEMSDTNTVTYLTNAVVEVKSLKIAQQGEATNAIEIANVTVSNAYIDAISQLVNIGSVSTRGGKLLLRRDKQGDINILTMVTPLPAEPGALKPAAVTTTNGPPTTAATNKPVFLANVHRFNVDDYSLRFEDLSNPRPVNVNFDQIAIVLTNISTAPGTVIGVAISHRWNQVGSVKVNGNFCLDPVKASADLDLENIVLAPGDPYLEQALSLHITDGAMNMKGHAEIELPKDGKPSIKYQGDFSIKNFATVDGVHKEDFVKWSNFQISKIDMQSEPMSVSVGEILMADHSIHASIWSNKTMNIMAILRQEPKPAVTNAPSVAAGTNAPATVAKTPPATEPAKPLPKISVGTLVFTNNVFRFTDKSIKPTASVSIDHFCGTISGITSEETGRTKVDLGGRIDGLAPFSIKGEGTPMRKALNADLKVVFQNIDLTAGSPYSGKYIGNALAKGALSIDLKYFLTNRNVEAENVIDIDHLTLGPKVESPDALQLPFGLAIALLKDVNGRIHLDVPVKGSIDDPEFRVAKVVWHTVSSLIVKAATSPFKLIGSMFGGGEEELSFLEFAGGSALLQTNELKKLDILNKALAERPALTLEIQGSIDEERDREALRRQRLTARLGAIKLQELRKTGQATGSTSQIALTKEEYVRYLKSEYMNASIKRGLKEIAKPAISSTTNAVANSQAQEGIRSVNDSHDAYVSTNTVGGVHRKPTDASTKPWTVLGKEGKTIPSLLVAKSAGSSARMAKLSPEEEIVAMERPLLDQIEIPPDDFRLLASDRAKRVQEHILKSGKLTAERVVLLEATTEPPPSKGARAIFNLK